MSDMYICSECSRSFRTEESFVNHCRFTGHSWDGDPIDDDGDES